ncbi:MAG: Nramp family divalent metal transporter [Blastocatellia bacterium]
MQATARQLSEAQEAPRDWRGVLSHIGPGIVVTGSVIGSGELISLPQRAASYGFALLWAVILSCVIKYWLQIEIGRYCLTRNLTTVQALNTLPGPKWRGTHIIPLLYLFGFLLSTVTLAGILTATAGLLANVSQDLLPNQKLLFDVRLWAVVTYVVTAALLYRGKYAALESFIAILVGGFSLSVLLCLALIQFTPYRVTAGQLASGLTFQTPPGAGYAIISLLGALGTGANELFMYPYWILESGYARFVGEKRGADAESWYARARGWLRVMKVDAAIATALSTVVTLGYYLVGAAVLRGREVGGLDVVKDVSRIFTETYGAWSYLVFMLGGFCTLYSTLVVIAAVVGRMGADYTASLGLIERRDEAARQKMIRLFTMLFLTLWLLLALFITEPQNYIAFGQFAIGVINTPLLIVGIVLLAFRTERRLRMSKAGAALLLASAAVFGLVLVRTMPETFANLGGVLRGLVGR